MHVSQRCYTALHWYFTQYESEIGLKAFDPARVHGGSFDPDTVMLNRMGTVQRARAIASALAGMPARHRRVLRLVHEPRQWPISDLPQYLRGIERTLRCPKGQPKTAWAKRRCEEAHESFEQTAKALGLDIT